jgi:hypothetical protein
MAAEVADSPVPLAEAAPEAATESPAAPADAKPTKAKKAAAPRKRANPTHPPYAEVIPLAVLEPFPVLLVVVFVSSCCSASSLDQTGRTICSFADDHGGDRVAQGEGGVEPVRNRQVPGGQA